MTSDNRKQPLLGDERDGFPLPPAEAPAGSKVADGGSPSRLRAILLLTAWIVVYQIFASANVILIKLMNYRWHVVEPVFTALLQKSGFLFSGVLVTGMVYIGGYRRSTMTRRLLARYMLLGLIGAAMSWATSIGMNVLSGTTYALLKASDLIFNVAMSKLFLKKIFTAWHMNAVFLVLVGVSLSAFQSLRDDKGSEKDPDGDDDALPFSTTVGVLATVLGALLDAGNTVLADKLLKGDTKPTPERCVSWKDGSKLKHVDFFIITEYGCYISIFSCLWLIVPLFVMGEPEKYHDSIGRLQGDALFLFILTSVFVSLSRLFVRVAKYQIVLLRSAFTFAVVKPTRRVLTILALIVCFGNETVGLLDGLGLASSMLGFASYIQGSRVLSARKKAAVTFVAAQMAVNHSAARRPSESGPDEPSTRSMRKVTFNEENVVVDIGDDEDSRVLEMPPDGRQFWSQQLVPAIYTSQELQPVPMPDRMHTVANFARSRRLFDDPDDAFLYGSFDEPN